MVRGRRTVPSPHPGGLGVFRNTSPYIARMLPGSGTDVALKYPDIAKVVRHWLFTIVNTAFMSGQW